MTNKEITKKKNRKMIFFPFKHTSDGPRVSCITVLVLLMLKLGNDRNESACRESNEVLCVIEGFTSSFDFKWSNSSLALFSRWIGSKSATCNALFYKVIKITNMYKLSFKKKEKSIESKDPPPPFPFLERFSISNLEFLHSQIFLLKNDSIREFPTKSYSPLF